MRYPRTMAWSLVLSFILSLAVVALADTATDARKAMKAVQVAYNRIDIAANAKNVKGFLAYNAPDYAIVDKNDVVRMRSDANMAAGYSAFFAASLVYKQQTTIQKLTLHDSEAVVTVKQHIERTASDPTTKQRVRSVMNGVLEETWIQNAKGWQRIRTTALEMHATENGKTINAR